MSGKLPALRPESIHNSAEENRKHGPLEFAALSLKLKGNLTRRA